MKSDLALGKLNLYRETGKEKFNMLSFGIFKETLRITVREKDNNPDAKQSRVLINMPIMFMYARVFLEELEALNDRQEGYTISLDMSGPKWDFNTKKRLPNQKELMGKLGLARKKDKEGNVVNLLTVTTNQNVMNVFPIINTPYLDIVRNGKRIEDKSVLSKIWTKAYARSLDHILSALPEVNNERDDSNPEFSNNKGYKKSYEKSGFKKAKPVNDSVDDVLDSI